MRALAAAALGATLVQAPPVFEAGVDLVYVDVFVSSRGQAVAGLTARDFLVRDNGVRQDVRVIDAESVSVTAVLLFDTSSSVAGQRLARLQAAGRAFVAGLGARDSAALVAFSHDVRLLAGPTADGPALRAALDTLEARGGTSIVDALYLCLKLDWGPGRPVLVVFTDGEDSASWLDHGDLLAAARESPAIVQVVGTEPERFPAVGDLRRRVSSDHVRELRGLAESTGGAYWHARSSDDIESAIMAALRDVRARYLLAYEPRGVARAGRHRLEVALVGRKADVRARREYVVPEPRR